jgi:hypothetical protein
MDYMFLIYSNEAQMAQITEELRRETISKHWAIQDEATSLGVFKGASRLDVAASALSVRADQGKVMMTDGPYAETKETLGGYYLIDCKDLEDAKYWAGRLAQTACGAVVELRPLRATPGRVDRGVPNAEPAAVANG